MEETRPENAETWHYAPTSRPATWW